MRREGGRWGEGNWHLFVIIPVARPSVSPECQQMLFEYLRPQKWCLLSVMIPLSWLTPPSIMRTLPLLVINDHWISWHSLTLGSILFLYIFLFDCNSASSCFKLTVQESPGPASLCQNIIKPREPGREELGETGRQAEGTDSWQY